MKFFHSVLAIGLSGVFAAALFGMVPTPIAAAEGQASSRLLAAGTEAELILWEDDFSGDWQNRWPIIYVNQDEQYSTHQVDGESWLRVIYPNGQERVGFHLKTRIESQDRVYLEYRFRFAEDFNWVKGGKLPGLYGGKTKAGVKPNGGDGFLVRFMWRADGKGSAYVYHPDQPGKYGHHFRLDNFWFRKGVVQTLGLEVVMNTPGKYDGVIHAWLDGALVVEETDVRFRNVPNLQIDGIKFDTIFGGNNKSWAPTKDETIDFGGFRILSAPTRTHGATTAPVP